MDYKEIYWKKKYNAGMETREITALNFKIGNKESESDKYLTKKEINSKAVQYKDKILAMSEKYDVAKDPKFSKYLDVWVKAGVKIDLVIVCLRDLHDTAESAKNVDFFNTDKYYNLIACRVGNLFTSLYKNKIRFKVMFYPRDYTDANIEDLFKEIKEKVERFNVYPCERAADDLIKKLSGTKRFTFGRFGDGEIMAIDGWKGKWKNHYVKPELMREMTEAFCIKDPEYMIAIQSGYEEEKGMREGVFSRFANDERLGEIIEEYGKRNKYYNAAALHYLNVFNHKKAKELHKAILKKKKILIVGGKHLKPARKMFNNADFAETPCRQSYYTLDDYYDEIVKKASKADLVLLGAGLCTNVIQKRLWLDKVDTQTIDIGSSFDAILGYKSRTWIKEKGDKIWTHKKSLDKTKS